MVILYLSCYGVLEGLPQILGHISLNGTQYLAPPFPAVSLARFSCEVSGLGSDFCLE